MQGGEMSTEKREKVSPPPSKSGVTWLHPNAIDETFVAQALEQHTQSLIYFDSEKTTDVKRTRKRIVPKRISSDEFIVDSLGATCKPSHRSNNNQKIDVMKKENKHNSTEHAAHSKTNYVEDTRIGSTKSMNISEHSEDTSRVKSEEEGEERKEHTSAGTGSKLHRHLVCDICGKTFSQKSGFEAHLRVHTGERPYKCIECGKAFKQMSGLSYHKKTHWEESNKMYFCEDCGKGYSSKQALDIHYKKHYDYKPYLCDYCERRYNDPNSLRRHMKYHTGPDVPCQEPSCKRKFTSKSEMIAHMHIHTGIKRFSCNTCLKSFVTKAKLQEHTLLHEGLRPFECPVCQRTFSQKTNMVGHVKRVHDVSPDYVHVEKVENGKFVCSLAEPSDPQQAETRGKHIADRRKCSKMAQTVVVSHDNEEISPVEHEEDGSHNKNCSSPVIQIVPVSEAYRLCAFT